ncbi:hypothetical protein JCM19046_4659 [Bacillus sp. JCM 19046]|nr:hypothetical protein JCM19045_4438 [Bacillus sp. JCM 19045]GAF19964.1 hypothetical protein JCM19046_4659 [Bacillus sp. JCM 19046]
MLPPVTGGSGVGAGSFGNSTGASASLAGIRRRNASIPPVLMMFAGQRFPLQRWCATTFSIEMLN